jgi:hypothetical protein
VGTGLNNRRTRRYDHVAEINDRRLITELDRSAINLVESKSRYSRKKSYEENEETHICWMKVLLWLWFDG